MPPTTTTTPIDILELAYARLAEISPESIATEGTELLLLVNRAMDGLFAFSARVNPYFYGKQDIVAIEGDIGWLRPDDAESVYRIELADGTEVAVVPFDQRHIEPGMPTVYPLGQYYRTTDLNLAPVGGSLIVFYSRRPVPAAALDSTLDGAWPEAFNELLALEVAIYLAMKGDLQAELQHLKGERDQWLARYVAFLQHETANIRRAWSTNKRIPASAVTLLAGGG